MTDRTIEREREEVAARALAQLRAITLPNAHPAVASLAEAIALAERYWHEAQAAVIAAERDQAKPHPEDYWSARWRM